MALQTKGDEGRNMADDERSEGRAARGRDEERGEIERAEGGRAEAADDHGPTSPPGAPVATGGGFLSVYKPGQGYWTRMCTAGAALLLLLFTLQFLYSTLRTRAGLETQWALAVAGAVGLVVVILGWRYFNKPHVVDFLVATESEMKKVNWTSRKELFGSTRVVILFMFLIAALLFVIDMVFGYFFYLIDVLKQSPFG